MKIAATTMHLVLLNGREMAMHPTVKEIKTYEKHIIWAMFK
jgi:hypothetical protein